MTGRDQTAALTADVAVIPTSEKSPSRPRGACPGLATVSGVKWWMAVDGDRNPKSEVSHRRVEERREFTHGGDRCHPLRSTRLQHPCVERAYHLPGLDTSIDEHP